MTREGYWEQVGAKSCITIALGVVVGSKIVFMYVTGRPILEEAGAHTTIWRMTELVIVQGDGLKAICRIRNTEKSVFFDAVARRRAYGAFRNAQDKFSTTITLLEARKLKAEKA